RILHQQSCVVRSYHFPPFADQRRRPWAITAVEARKPCGVHDRELGRDEPSVAPVDGGDLGKDRGVDDAVPCRFELPHLPSEGGERRGLRLLEVRSDRDTQ